MRFGRGFSRAGGAGPGGGAFRGPRPAYGRIRCRYRLGRGCGQRRSSGFYAGQNGFQIEGTHAPVMRVRTISLGGAYLESKRKLSVGDSIKLEIRSGLRRIHSTAVVRNLGPDGNGIEFVHMLDEDREKLRRLVQRRLRD